MDRHKFLDLLLSECLSIFRQQQLEHQSTDNAHQYGQFPDSAIIIHKDRFHPKFFGLGNPVAAWKMNADSLIECSLPVSDWNRNDCRGMFYRVAYFSIAFPDDLSCGRIVISCGPKYGVKYTYPIIQTGNDLRLGEPEVKSVS